PDWSGYADPTSTLLRTWLTTSQVGLVHLALALAGLIAGLAGLVSTRDGAAWPRWLLPVGLVLGAGGALGLLGVQVIMGAGYGMAVLVPLAALLVTVQLVRRGGPGRWAALAGAGVVAAT